VEESSYLISSNMGTTEDFVPAIGKAERAGRAFDTWRMLSSPTPLQGPSNPLLFLGGEE